MSRRAFTLVELLVVITIIGLLSTIAVVSLSSARSKARDTKRIADIRQISTAMQMYQQDNGTYPRPSLLVSCSGGDSGHFCLGHGSAGSCWTGSMPGCTALDDALAPYIAKIPDDPENATGYYGDAYVYRYSGSNSGGGYTAVAPYLHYGADSYSSCLSGGYQWGSGGRNRWACFLILP